MDKKVISSIQDKGCTKDISVNKEVVLPPEQVFSAASLPRFKETWESITTDPVTLDAVSGLTIPFRYLPPCRLPTREELLSLDEDPVVDASIAELLALKAAAVQISGNSRYLLLQYKNPDCQDASQCALLDMSLHG